MNATCPECYANLEISDDVVVGEIITCHECGVELEVVDTGSGMITLKVAEAMDEDWGE